MALKKKRRYFIAIAFQHSFRISLWNGPSKPGLGGKLNGTH